MHVVMSLALTVLAADAEYKKVDEVDGITVESRPVEGSSFLELRFRTLTTVTPQALCEEVYGHGKYDPTEPDLKSREILFESENERVTFDRMTPAVVSPRSYVMRMKRSWVDGACHLDFGSANDVQRAVEPGYVMVTKVHGLWRFEPFEGKTRLTYVIFSDPAGALPAFFVEGARRQLALKWVKRVIARAGEAKPDAGVP